MLYFNTRDIVVYLNGNLVAEQDSWDWDRASALFALKVLYSFYSSVNL